MIHGAAPMRPSAIREFDNRQLSTGLADCTA
jgi:hypothetical protein